jgi:hypothetical protein
MAKGKNYVTADARQFTPEQEAARVFILNHSTAPGEYSLDEPFDVWLEKFSEDCRAQERALNNFSGSPTGTRGIVEAYKEELQQPPAGSGPLVFGRYEGKKQAIDEILRRLQ